MATPSLTRHTLDGALGPLLVDVRTSDRQLPRPAVLIVHGFKGFKDWGMFPPLAERLARAGFSAVSFNLSGSGVDAQGDFTRADCFARNTYSAEVADIRTMLDALETGRLDMPPTPHVGLVGHSRGGCMAILAAAGDARVQALVTWAAISKVSRWDGKEEAWRAAGYFDSVNSRTGQVLRISTDVLDDVRDHAAALDILAAARRLTQPWLLLHGTEDESVPVAEARALGEGWQPGHPRRLHLVDGGGHTFGAVHPFAGMTPQLAEAFDETLKWLGRHL